MASSIASPAVSAFQEAAEQDAPFDSLRATLRAFRERRAPLAPSVLDALKQIKADAVAAGDQAVAGAAWCYEQIAKVQDEYLRAWQLMREDRFYGAWGALEQAELALHFLARHFDDATDLYGLAFLRTHIPHWQSLFPYKVFISPGFTKRSVSCSVCGARLTPRRGCGHRLGHLYDGEMCFHRVAEVHMIEISLVTRPVQKYSVAFPKDSKFNYAAVHYVVSGLLSPWHRWEPHWTTRQWPDPMYVGVGRNAPCPCGSGKKFKKCHLSDSTYEAPHVEIRFSDGKAAGLPAERYGEPHYGVDDMGGARAAGTGGTALLRLPGR
jgi:hypothetical protein